jgi:dTDP-4-amino-4,6-dideoxygalactose transaminase
MRAYEQLEQEYRKFVGSRFSVSCNSGTSALHLAFLAIGLKPGDEVIMCDFAMSACAFAVSYCGATPVFVDCDDALNIDVSLVQEKITKKTKAILAIHTYGRLCDMKELVKIAGNNDIYLIEDACEAQGAVYKSKADITCYSFYENKIIHAEEGGIATTNSKLLADKMRYYKNMCFTEAHDYMHNHIGYNYRMPDSQAKLALESLANYPKENKRRRGIESLMSFSLDERPYRDAVWVIDTLLPLPKGIETRPFFKPLSSFPMYGGKCQSPKAEYYSKIGHYIKI